MEPNQSSASQVAIEPEYLRRREAAAYLNIPVATLDSWQSRPPAHGRPPSIKVGRTRLYGPRQALLGWLASFADDEGTDAGQAA